MKIDIRDFFENYQDTEIEIQPNQDFDRERLIRMTRRELGRKKIRRVATTLAAAVALVAVVFAAGIGVTYETSSAEVPWFASDNEGEGKTVSSWIGELFNSLKAKKVSYGDQKKEPGMTDWGESKQGMLLEFQGESEAETVTEPTTGAETEAVTENAVEAESEAKVPAYLEGPEVGEKITLVAVRYGYVPQSGQASEYESRGTLKERLEISGYTAEEMAAAWSEEELNGAYVYVTKELKPSLDYMIQVIQPYEVETRTFSFHGETSIVKNDIIGEWEATWLTVNQNNRNQDLEEEYAEMPQESKDWWQQIDHHLLLYHPTKHYLINLSVDAKFHALEELEKMAADIVVVEAEMEANASIHKSISFPDQTFSLNAMLG